MAPGTRVVSLIASATEIVCALGFGRNLVGRSHECDYPEWVKDLPVCTEPRFDPHGSSAEVDARVKKALREAFSVYRVDEERLRALAPHVIVTQSQCEVCAVSLKDVERAVRQWTGGDARIVSLEPNALAGIWRDIARVAGALGAPEEGEKLAAKLQARMAAIAGRARGLRRPTVACIEWIDPLMAAGNWMPELVGMAGGENLFGEAGARSPWMEWSALVDRDPEVIAVLPCGYGLAKTREEMRALTSRPGWHRLRAVREGRVALTDGNQYFNRPGPRGTSTRSKN
ncbi:MAG: cobalamin-binding protein [Nitrospinota bacterium]